MSVKVKETKDKGRGVFALKDFSIDSLIEECEIIICPSKDTKQIINTKIGNYLFSWGGGCYCLALGNGSLYNHSYEPNAYYEIDNDDKKIKFYSIKKILKGEEITVNYNGEPSDESKVWFNVKK